jgi:hypothetical protein
MNLRMRSACTILLALAPVAAAGGTGSRLEEKRWIGDVNGDGMIDPADAYAVLGHENGSFRLEGAALHAADVDGNRRVDLGDAEALLRLTMEPVAVPPFEPVPAGLPVLREVRPAQGLPGSPVVLLGSGFSPIPGKNVVRFGALRAEVLEAATDRLVTRVPAGAISGAVSVEVLGVRGLGAAFLVGTPPLPRPARPPAPGEVHLAVPSGGVANHAVGWAPFLFHTGPAPFGVLSARLRFDPTQLAALGLVPGYAPLSLVVHGKDGIDNAAGSLGVILYHAGVGAAGAPPRGLVSGGAVLFTAVRSIPALDAVQGVVGRFRDASFPGVPLGGAEPFFVSQEFTSPVPVGATEDVPRVAACSPPAATPGTEVRLLGRNLGPAQTAVTVLFGVFPATGWLVSSEEARVVVPSRLVTLIRGDLVAANSVALGVLPDVTPPRVLRTSLPPAGGLLPATGSIQVDFSEVIDPFSVEPAALYVEGVDYYGLARESPEAPTVKVPCSLTLSQVHQSSLRITPVFPLPRGPWRLVVTGKVRDLVGNPLENPLSVPFAVP